MYTVTFTMTEDDVQRLIDEINKHPTFFLSVEDCPITLDECKANPDLLAYVCDLDWKEYTMSDLGNYWANDGWCDVDSLRKA